MKADIGRMLKIGIPHRLDFPCNDEVHVWTAYLSESQPFLRSLEPLLSADERHRADRFLQAEDKSRYIASHGILRQLLGRYMGVAAADLSFACNAFGKPALVPLSGQRPLSFNLAHSGEVILIAMAAGQRVGIDVEFMRLDIDVNEIAVGQFSREEIQVLQEFHPSEQRAAFFRCWTRKEAYVKARGEGLAIPLPQFTVALGRDELPAIKWALDDPSVSDRWSMFDLVTANGYAGAVTVEGQGVRLTARRWEERCAVELK